MHHLRRIVDKIAFSMFMLFWRLRTSITLQYMHIIKVNTSACYALYNVYGIQTVSVSFALFLFLGFSTWIIVSYNINSCYCVIVFFNTFYCSASTFYLQFLVYTFDDLNAAKWFACKFASNSFESLCDLHEYIINN